MRQIRGSVLIGQISWVPFFSLIRLSRTEPRFDTKPALRCGFLSEVPEPYISSFRAVNWSNMDGRVQKGRLAPLFLFPSLPAATSDSGLGLPPL